jgi:calcineurin-like phosphoesterase family protein
MSNTYFTADIHGDHRNIIKYSGRTFCMGDAEIKEYDRRISCGDYRMKDWRVSDESIERMHDHIFGKINEIVEEYDTLWILGDFYLKHNLQRLVDLRYRIKCKTINYVWGNHDQWWRERCPPYLFNEYHDCCHTVVNSQRIWLSHYCHVVWPKSHKGCWHLFGHSHGSLNPWIKSHMPNAKMLDVGIDNAKLILGEYRPFSLEEVKDYMNCKSGEWVDHHKADIEEDD